jgi:hypothetical protein
MTHDLKNGWTAKRNGKGFDVFRYGVFQFYSCRLKAAKTEIAKVPK